MKSEFKKWLEHADISAIVEAEVDKSPFGENVLQEQGVTRPECIQEVTEAVKNFPAHIEPSKEIIALTKMQFIELAKEHAGHKNCSVAQGAAFMIVMLNSLWNTYQHFLNLVKQN